MDNHATDVLLVEDNFGHAELILLAMQKSHPGSRVIWVKDGVEALDYLFATGEYAGRDRHHLPKLILLDLKLPRVNGLEVLERVKSDERTRMIPVVCMTSSQDENDVRGSYRLGANSYVLKSVNYVALSETIESLVRYWLNLNKLPF